MSWRGLLSRYVNRLHFTGSPGYSDSHGLRSWLTNTWPEIELLNPDICKSQCFLPGARALVIIEWADKSEYIDVQDWSEEKVTQTLEKTFKEGVQSRPDYYFFPELPQDLVTSGRALDLAISEEYGITI